MTNKIRGLVLTAAGAAGVIAGRRAAEAGWRTVRHEPPPQLGDASPGDDDTALRDLLAWGVVLSATTAVARRLGVAVADRAFDRVA